MPLFKRPREDEAAVRTIERAAPLGEYEAIARELSAWEFSGQRREMLDGERYYAGDHDILRRRRTVIGEGGKTFAAESLPNTRIVDNQYARHADIKTNYLLGKPVTFACPDAKCAEALGKTLGADFMRTLRRAALTALNCGVAWLYPFINGGGELQFKMFSGAQIMPLWKDAEHKSFDTAVRLYFVEEYAAGERRLVKKADIFTPKGVLTCVFSNGAFIPEGGRRCYVNAGERGYNWERLPLIPIRCNAHEIPLIRRARSLQDAINILESDLMNRMQEDVHNTVLILKNYDGQDLGEFRRNLMTYGAVKVRTVEGHDGGVESLRVEVNASGAETALKMLKRALTENVKSCDAKDDRMGQTPNQMNIRSMYSDMDLDANAMETEIRAAFYEILRFVSAYFALTGRGGFSPEEISVIFNRDTLINESEAVENCVKSKGIISDETIISMHPWVEDPAREKERMK
ncbi:MAG: phage portal protein [Clostridia bacterium]|nr:phage portal protein [Clostridia bacterium]